MRRHFFFLLLLLLVVVQELVVAESGMYVVREDYRRGAVVAPAADG